MCCIFYDNTTKRSVKAVKHGQYLFTFLMGFFCYSLIEIVGRGYTHWTMAVTGGTVLMILYTINNIHSLTLVKRCLAGAAVITSIEFIVGIFDNIIMHWYVWDYSNVPLNILGQICPLFSALWFLICIPAYFICGAIQKKFV